MGKFCFDHEIEEEYRSYHGLPVLYFFFLFHTLLKPMNTNMRTKLSRRTPCAAVTSICLAVRRFLQPPPSISPSDLYCCAQRSKLVKIVYFGLKTRWFADLIFHVYRLRLKKIKSVECLQWKWRNLRWRRNSDSGEGVIFNVLFYEQICEENQNLKKCYYYYTNLWTNWNVNGVLRLILH